MNISYKDYVTNEEIRRKIQAAIGEYGELLTLAKKWKLRWFGHVSRSSGLAKIILQGKNKENITVFFFKNAASDMLHSIILHRYVNVMWQKYGLLTLWHITVAHK